MYIVHLVKKNPRVYQSITVSDTITAIQDSVHGEITILGDYNIENSLRYTQPFKLKKIL